MNNNRRSAYVFFELATKRRMVYTNLSFLCEKEKLSYDAVTYRLNKLKLSKFQNTHLTVERIQLAVQ